MFSILSPRVTLVWGLLVLATCTSWALGTDQGVGASPSTASVIILLVAFVKARFVGSHFMELRDAPALLRRGFDGCCVLACACLIGVYALA